LARWIKVLIRYFIILLVIIFFTSCSLKNQRKEAQNTFNNKANISIYDLQNIPQDINLFAKQVHNNNKLYEIQKKYEKYYFRPWNFTKPNETLKNIKWPFRTYKAGKSYGENLQLLNEYFFDNMYNESNFDKYLTLNKKAVTLKHLSIRVFPTCRPLFRDPFLAGEGFPFDYLQNSTVCANKPVFVSHLSKNKEWAYIFTSFTSGWVKSSDIVFLDDKYTKEWQKAREVFLTKDNVAIYSKEGRFLFSSRIGMMLPLISKSKDNYIVLSVAKYKNSKPFYVKAVLPKQISHEGVLTFNKKNITDILSEVLKSNYGWGGMYGQRDCSSAIRDIFAPFGIWLPRNSFQQAKIGEVMSIEGLNDKQKLQFIKQKAIPFETLLYKKGHIMLYVGTYKDNVVIFHDTWGIKTKSNGINGRIIIGKAILSTPEIGKYQKNYDENLSILRNLSSMNIITH